MTATLYIITDDYRTLLSPSEDTMPHTLQNGLDKGFLVSPPQSLSESSGLSRNGSDVRSLHDTSRASSRSPITPDLELKQTSVGGAGFRTYFSEETLQIDARDPSFLHIPTTRRQ